MSGDHREEGRRFARFMESMAPEKRAEISRLEHEDNERIHAEFRSAFAAGRCSMCDEQLDSFLPKKPCHHWLLKPAGFTKRDFEKVTAEYGVFQLQSYLRWVANEAAFAQNITDQGDLSTADGKLIEVTIRYNQLEWSFSCGQNDYLGHRNARKGAFPHYHFQMRINGRPFITTTTSTSR